MQEIDKVPVYVAVETEQVHVRHTYLAIHFIAWNPTEPTAPQCSTPLLGATKGMTSTLRIRQPHTGAVAFS